MASIMQGFGRAIKGTKKRLGVIGGVVKEGLSNPGKATRKLTAGAVKDPAGTVVNLAGQVAPIPGASLPAVAAAPHVTDISKRIIPKGTQKSMRRTSREIMNDSGTSRASRFGRALEHRVNQGAMALSNLQQYLP